MKSYNKTISSFTELPEVISEVGALMGIRGFRNVASGPAFSDDVLRIEVTGETGLHLSVVDLPGLIATASEEQTEEDVQTVQNMVENYVKESRTIILAVVQANNDIANQSIIQRPRRHDAKGVRTVGIITKPDLINRGTEKRIALLARNEDSTKLKLGFFLLKNPSPEEMQASISLEERQMKEARFFASSPWREQLLDPSRVGIVSLRTKLQDLLDRHVGTELPKVRSEVQQLLKKTTAEMDALGEERSTVGHYRVYMSSLAMQFFRLTDAALKGDYSNGGTDFFKTLDEDEISPQRLRAVIHHLNTKYSDYMRNKGRKRTLRDPFAEMAASEDDQAHMFGHSVLDESLVDKKEMRSWIKQVRRRVVIELQTMLSLPRRLTSTVEAGNFQAITTVSCYRISSSSS